MQEKRLLRSTADSLSRRADSKAEVASATNPAPVLRKIRTLTKPGSPTSTMRKVGVALIAAPDPITGIPGVALVASSYLLKSKEPATLANLAQETRKVLRDLESIRL
ncbi:MAG: hypothetical protein OK404_00905 [Thaumarchaeota archaeon]|nr:hypothetical protein [Nitrososphaerota archaeon]